MIAKSVDPGGVDMHGTAPPRQDPGVQEVEIKLSVAPAAAAGVASLPTLRQGGGRPRTQRLISTYFDTADLRLTRAGITLRVRQHGRRRVQTIKLAGTSAGGLHRRTEVEAAIRGDSPELSAIADARLRARVVRLVGERPLVPLSRTVFDRRLWTIGRAEGRVEVAFDRGEIVAGDRREPICEIEIELQSGPTRVAFAVAREIAGLIDAQPLDRSKFERALALAAPDAPPPQRAPPPVAADDPPALALARIVAACVRWLQQHHRSLLAGYDVEGVHQMRVALRRLAVARRVFRSLAMPEPLAEEMRWLRRLFGEARNWDVFFEALLEPVARACPDDRELPALGEAAAVMRSAARGAVLEAARLPRYRLLVLDLIGWAVALEEAAAQTPTGAGGRAPETAVGPFASRLVRRRWVSLQKEVAAIPAMSDAERHRTRIHAKRLRYSVEFFAEVIPGSLARRIDRRTRKLQSLLGNANDLATARTLLAALEQRLAPCTAAQARTIGLLHGWCAFAASQAVRKIERQA